MRISPYLFFLLFLVLRSTNPAGARSYAAQAASPASGSYRSCTANPVWASTAQKKARKTKHPIAAEPAPACLEVQGEGIEIQEFLQSTVREEQWRAGENHASEDTWSFVRYLSVEDLERYAETKVLTEAVKFSGGRVAIVVRTSELADGYARVQITTHFQGEGKSTDKVMGQPATVWPLTSRGVLEKELLTALQSRFHHAR